MGSRPSAPVSYRPTPTAATVYQSVVPEADYENLSNYIGELKAEREKKKKDREAMGFGGSQFQKRIAQYSKAEQDAYKASQPKKPPGSPGSTSTTPTV